MQRKFGKKWVNQTIFSGDFLCSKFGTAIFFSDTSYMTSQQYLSYGVLTDIVDFGISVDM